VKKVLYLKDLFDYIVYGCFGLAIYYAYQNYQKSNQFKKEIEANIVKIENFKHKLYQIKGFILPEFIISKLKDFKNFQTKTDDIWVASFPKSGKKISHFHFKKNFLSN
jgi:hypothetical protein